MKSSLTVACIFLKPAWQAFSLRSAFTALLLAPIVAVHAADQQTRPDIVIADFEQGYGNWTVEGEAFNHPTTRFLPPDRQPFTGLVPIQTGAGFDNIPLDFLPISQPPVGHAGKGLADSWDPSYGFSLKGIMTSPQFTIERRYIRFQIAGFRGSLELFIDGKKEFQLEANGSRTLQPWAIDVSPFLGRRSVCHLFSEVVHEPGIGDRSYFKKS
jgi:hypothetical protein